MAYPYSKSETIADAAVHAAGLVIFIPATWVLASQAAELPRSQFAGFALYAACLLFAFAASATYHLCPNDRARRVLRRIDHAAIYLKIAGSYTPFVIIIGSAFAYGILGVVWALGIIGAIAKLSFWSAEGRGSLALYLVMGWLSALLIWPIYVHFDASVTWLVVAGGLIYSAGTRIYAHPGMRFQNAIWHGLVLVASACLFAAIALSVEVGLHAGLDMAEPVPAQMLAAIPAGDHDRMAP